jgi:hypothetical protein
MTPPPQADAPPTPDEMRLAEQLVDDWYPGMPENRDYLVKRVAADIAAALSTTAAQAETRVRQECAEVARNYRLHEPDRVCCMGRNERIAAAILASGLQTTPQETNDV